jgi:hypothetical protein
MSIEKSLRLYPNETEFLNQYRMNIGEIFYDKNKNTLVLFDGVTKGGIPLLRADLSNISGGGSVSAGTINFGTTSIQAQSFVGDGSLLTNLPIPDDLATISFVNEAIENVTIGPATAETLGTVKVGIGLSITPDGVLSSDAVTGLTSLINLDLLQFKLGVGISKFSNDGSLGGIESANDVVPTELAVKTYVDTSISNIDLDGNGVIQSGLATQLPFYPANGNTLSAANIFWNSVTGTLTTQNIAATNNLSVTNTISSKNVNASENITASKDMFVGENLTVVGDAELGNIISQGYLNVSEIFNDNIGAIKFGSGSDFYIDTPGFVDVGNSRIVRVGDPVDPKDAVNKEYVDGAASAFSGGLVPNPINITSTQASNSTTTGALTVAGGVGVSGSIYAGGSIFVDGSPVLTSLSGGYNGGTISGTLFINNTTASSNTTSGALRVAGGVGIGRSLYVGADGFFNSIRVGNGTNNAGDGFLQNIVFGAGTPLGANISGVNNVAFGFNNLAQISDGSDNIAIGNQSMFNKTVGGQNIGIGTDTLIQHSGFGNIAIGTNAGSLLLTGDFNVIIGSNSGSSIDELDKHVLICDGQGNIKIQFNEQGALGLAGSNYGVLGAILLSQGSNLPPIWGSPDDLLFTGGNVPNATTFLSTADSDSSNNGAVIVAGGVGIAKNLNVGGTFSSGSISSSGTISGTSIESTPIGSTNRSSGAFTTLTSNGVTTVTNATASSASNNGALVVTGGLGVGGTVNANIVNANLSTLGSITVTGTSNLQQISEVLDTKINATGTVVHDFSTAAIWYHTTPANNFTANFTNVPIVNNRVLTVALVVVQGATARVPTAVQVNSAAVTLTWFNNTTPPGTANRFEIFTFNLIRVNNTWRALGAAQAF